MPKVLSHINVIGFDRICASNWRYWPFSSTLLSSSLRLVIFIFYIFFFFSHRKRNRLLAQNGITFISFSTFSSLSLFVFIRIANNRVCVVLFIMDWLLLLSGISFFFFFASSMNEKYQANMKSFSLEMQNVPAWLVFFCWHQQQWTSSEKERKKWKKIV